jgi:hypothetical protein
MMLPSCRLAGRLTILLSKRGPVILVIGPTLQNIRGSSSGKAMPSVLTAIRKKVKEWLSNTLL